jgi:Uma2 family endonuclease
MTVQLELTTPVEDTVFYPETDGIPMGESDLHRKIMYHIIHLLERFFAGRPVYVTGNLILYYERGNPRKSIVPDCFVAPGVEPRLRPIYKLWEEPAGPQVVFEVSSKSTQREDFGAKMRVYAQLGVQEYYIYDPTGDYLNPALAAFQWVGGGYVPMSPVNGEPPLSAWLLAPEASPSPQFVSPLLGLRLALDADGQLQFYDEETGQRLLTDEEAWLQAEAAKEQAEAAKEQAEAAKEQAEERAARAEAENAHLRAELERLRGRGNG